MTKQLRIPAVAAALLSAVAMAPGRQNSEAVTVTAVRFYQPAAATTTIEGVCEIRLGALLRGASRRSNAYRVEVGVLDSAGLELQHSSWSREIPAAAAFSSSATAVESFEFNA